MKINICFSRPLKKNLFPFCKNLLSRFWNQKPIVKSRFLQKGNRFFFNGLLKHMLILKKNLFPFCNQKPIVKSKCQKLFVFWKTHFYNFKYENQCTLGKHILYLIIELKTFNVSQFYNGYCCYLKFTCSSDKVIKLFILSCLHLVRLRSWKK